jgi:hypothetical protein
MDIADNLDILLFHLQKRPPAENTSRFVRPLAVGFTRRGIAISVFCRVLKKKHALGKPSR